MMRTGTKAYEQSVTAEEIETLVDFYDIPCFYTNIEVSTWAVLTVCE